MRAVFERIFHHVLGDRVYHFIHIDHAKQWIELIRREGRILYYPPRFCVTRTLYLVGDPQFTEYDICIVFKKVKEEPGVIWAEYSDFRVFPYMCHKPLIEHELLFYFEEEGYHLTPHQMEYYTQGNIYPDDLECIYYITEGGKSWAIRLARICNVDYSQFPQLDTKLLELYVAVGISYIAWQDQIQDSGFPTPAFQLYWDLAEALPREWHIYKCKREFLEHVLEWCWPEEISKPDKLPIPRWFKQLVISDETIKKVSRMWHLDETRIKSYIIALMRQYFEGGVRFTRTEKEKISIIYK